MRGNKTKKIVIVTFISVLLILIAIFVYLFVYSNMYKLECSRQDEGMTERFVFEFDTFRNVKKRIREIELTFNTEQGAIDFYNNNYAQNEETKKLVKVEKNKIIIQNEFVEGFVSKTLKEAKQTSLSWGYECKMVRK